MIDTECVKCFYLSVGLITAEVVKYPTTDLSVSREKLSATDLLNGRNQDHHTYRADSYFEHIGYGNLTHHVRERTSHARW